MFDCGILSEAGKFVAQLREGDRILTVSVPFSGVWPLYNLTLPPGHIAQEETHPTLTSKYVQRYTEKVSCKPQTTDISLEVSEVIVPNTP